jgi:spore coat protein U-like protein
MNVKNIIVLYLLFLQTFIYSQGSNSTINIPISISISSSLSINKVSGDLDFGEVLSTATTQTLTKDPEFGVLFEVNGIARERITVDYSNSVVLDNHNWVSFNGSGVEDDLLFTPNVRHTGRRSTYVNSNNLRDGRRIRLRNDNGTGKLFIWVGGDLEVKPNQKAGDYEGTFNITVAY